MKLFLTSKKSLIVISVSGGFILALLLLVLFNAATRIADDEAAGRVGQYLRTELSQRHMAELQGLSRKVPDRETALKWQEDYRRIDSLKISEIKVKRPIPDIIFHPDQPTYVVRVAFSLEGKELPPRYFWLGWPRFDREVSPFFWNVSL